VNRPVFGKLDYFDANYSVESLSKKIASNLKPKYPIQYFVTHYTPLVERKQHILTQLQRAGIEEYTFIETKDRDVLVQEDVNRFKQISISEMSLFLKHVEVFKTCNLEKYVVVLEDDAILCDNFVDNLTECLKQLQCENWDVLFSAECCNLHCEMEPGRLVKQTNYSRGTCMYVLNFGVGRILCEILDASDIINRPIDLWFNGLADNIKCFWSEPTLVSQGTDTGLFKTSINLY
jgi:GR25 family glycosyltransferase involved in LPS biosynthesis